MKQIHGDENFKFDGDGEGEDEAKDADKKAEEKKKKSKKSKKKFNPTGYPASRPMHKEVRYCCSAEGGGGDRVCIVLSLVL